MSDPWDNNLERVEFRAMFVNTCQRILFLVKRRVLKILSQSFNTDERFPPYVQLFRRNASIIVVVIPF